jgi:hypothetical protein
LAHRVFEWVKLVFPDVNVYVHGHVHVEIRDLSEKTKSYDPSALVSTHSKLR